MSITDFIKGIVNSGSGREMEAVGVISQAPKVVEAEDASESYLAFRLDSEPDLQFHQPIRALAPERHKGDRVRVHYRLDDDDTAVVNWVEKA